MATFNSVEHAQQIANPPVLLDTTQDRGRIRIGHFDITGIVSAASSDDFNLLRLPAGRIRILRCSCKHGAWAASSTLSFGHRGFIRTSDKATVAAAATAFTAAIAMPNTTDIDLLSDVVIDSTQGFTLVGFVGGAAGGTLPATTGFIEYVID
jgi:hypothetical protein